MTGVNVELAKQAEIVAKRIARRRGFWKSSWEMFLVEAYAEIEANPNPPQPMTLKMAGAGRVHVMRKHERDPYWRALCNAGLAAIRPLRGTRLQRRPYVTVTCRNCLRILASEGGGEKPAPPL